MSESSKSLSLDDEVKEVLRLKSNEGKVFEVPKKICMISQVISTLADNDKDADEIPLTNVNGPTLEKVIDYMRLASENYVTTMERPLKSNEMVDFV
jgi:S-phase kinase-associated protein 1